MAVALAPQAVDAASKAFRLVGKSGRSAQVDKKGKLSVAVKNQPSVKVPGGVAVINQPSVKVPDGVSVTNQPSVKVPDGVAVTNEPSVKVPGGVAAETRPSTREVVNEEQSRDGVGWIPLMQVPAGRGGAVTEITLTGDGPAGVQQYRLETWVRKGASGSCNAPNLTEFDRHIQRQVTLANNSTLQLTFPDAPLLIPRATTASQVACFGVVAVSAPNGSQSHVGSTGFLF